MAFAQQADTTEALRPQVGVAGPLHAGEARPVQHFYVLLALALVLGFFLLFRMVLVPASRGEDPNGYLVGGKQLARTGTPAFQPRSASDGQFDPQQFVGVMWVGRDYGTPHERYYPKYPLGYPALVALAFRAGGAEGAVARAYLVNPICATAALLGTFLLVRRFAGSLAGILALLALGASPVLTVFAIVPVSHASAMAFVVLGFVLLLRWWDDGGVWAGILGGLALGFAGIIRYTELALLLPLALVVLFGVLQRWKLRTGIEAAAVLLAWAVPVGTQLIFNRVALRTWTGYGPTNESEAFGLDYFLSNWDLLLRHLSGNGLFFLLPIGVAGAVWMFARDWKKAAVLAAWILPCWAIYSCYYFAKDYDNLGYVRFLATTLPALLAAGFWLLRQMGASVAGVGLGWRWTGYVLASGAVVLLSSAVLAKRSVLELESALHSGTMLDITSEELRRVAPAGSIVFSDDGYMNNHLQFAGDWLLYNGRMFNQWNIAQLNAVNSEEPQVLDPGRRKALYERLKNLEQSELTERQRALMRTTLASGRRVFYLTPTGEGFLPRPGYNPSYAPRGLRGVIDGNLRIRAAASWRIVLERPDRRPARQRLWNLAPPPPPERKAWVLWEVVGK